MSFVTTPYGKISESVFKRCASLTLLVLDVDGVLSDGLIYMGNNGEELKAFNTKDGYGIKAVQSVGVDVAVITGRSSRIVQERMQALNVKHIIQGTEEKQVALQKLIETHQYHPSTTASMGDDMPDLGLFSSSDVKVAVADAHPLIKHAADLTTTLSGGRGAVREFCDLILQAKDALQQIHGASL